MVTREIIHWSFRIGLLLWLSHSTALAETNSPFVRKYSNLERLELKHLKAVHQQAQALRSGRKSVPPLPGLDDYRCILHAHAEDSEHTGGTLPEMLADAKKAGISAILLTDHFRPPRDFIDGRWRGLHDGVLFIPGSEIRGCLIYPIASILDKMEQPFPEFLKTVTRGNGMIFLSHIEERVDHPLDGMTGLEICNRHYDAKRDMASLVGLALKLTDPAQLAELQEAVRLYPDEVLDFQCDYPEVYLKKWDQGTASQRLTGVAANDCHHNQVLVIKMVDEETVLLGTVVDKDSQMRKITASSRPGIKQLTKGHKPGEILARVDVDPYERSFWNSSTHILAARLDEAALRSALKSGHAYVAHDWICEARGFRFEALAKDGKPVGIMGDEVRFTDELKLSARFPISCEMRLLRNGIELSRNSSADHMEIPVSQAGVYRLEAWLTLDDEARPWIFSDPIYVR